MRSIRLLLLAVLAFALTVPGVFADHLQANCPLTYVGSTNPASPFFLSPHGTMRNGNEVYVLRGQTLTTGYSWGDETEPAVYWPLLAIVPWLTVSWGWQGAFIATGAVGFLWVFLWAWAYRAPDRHPRVSAAELAYIRKDPPEPAARIRWLELIAHRQTWAFMIGMMASSPTLKQRRPAASYAAIASGGHAMK